MTNISNMFLAQCWRGETSSSNKFLPEVWELLIDLLKEMTFMFKKYTLSSHINKKCVTWVDYRGLKNKISKL